MIFTGVRKSKLQARQQLLRDALRDPLREIYSNHHDYVEAMRTCEDTLTERGLLPKDEDVVRVTQTRRSR